MDTPKEIITDLSYNKVLFITLYAWLITQTIKVITGVIREKRFNFRWFIGTGGMPSSHSATVSALTTGVGLYSGFGSIDFVIALVFSIIVIFDAQGVRRATGKQAGILNKMLEDIYWKKHIQEDRLKELLGHTPVEVIVGVASGIIIALFLWHFAFSG